MEQDEDAQPVYSPRNLGIVRDLVMRCNPGFVFLPHGNDTNTGHQVVYRLLRQVAGEIGFPITAFLSRDPKTVRMRIDCYTEFGEEEARWKGQLLRYHASQHQRNLTPAATGLTSVFSP